jgi:hypothetical protein
LKCLTGIFLCNVLDAKLLRPSLARASNCIVFLTGGFDRSTRLLHNDLWGLDLRTVVPGLECDPLPSSTELTHSGDPDGGFAACCPNVSSTNASGSGSAPCLHVGEGGGTVAWGSSGKGTRQGGVPYMASSRRSSAAPGWERDRVGWWLSAAALLHGLIALG